jgi:hypothetical protein
MPLPLLISLQSFERLHICVATWMMVVTKAAALGTYHKVWLCNDCNTSIVKIWVVNQNHIETFLTK